MHPLPPDPDTVLEVRDLRTFFRTDGHVVKAVDGVSFTVRRGETLGLVGESGSGKSVACLSALRLLPSPPAFHPSGQILYRGHDLLAAPERELERLRGDRLAMIFQDPMTSLNPYLTVARQLTEVLEVHKAAVPAAARRAAITMLERVGIPDAGRRIDQHPHQFSGGMRQRVMIAMALACEPDLVIADEPTTALDVTIQAQILSLLADLRKRLGTAILLITHDLGVVAETCDDVAVMYAGRIVERAPADVLFSRPLHPYTIGLLAARPDLDAVTGGARPALRTIPGMVPPPQRFPSGCRFHPRCGHARPVPGDDGPACAALAPDLREVEPGHCGRCHYATRLGEPHPAEGEATTA
jgi:oligopeptide/dipeptide ABC transporter ATP-binding protein